MKYRKGDMVLIDLQMSSVYRVCSVIVLKDHIMSRTAQLLWQTDESRSVSITMENGRVQRINTEYDSIVNEFNFVEWETPLAEDVVKTMVNVIFRWGENNAK